MHTLSELLSIWLKELCKYAQNLCWKPFAWYCGYLVKAEEYCVPNTVWWMCSCECISVRLGERSKVRRLMLYMTADVPLVWTPAPQFSWAPLLSLRMLHGTSWHLRHLCVFHLQFQSDIIIIISRGWSVSTLQILISWLNFQNYQETHCLRKWTHLN